MLHVFKRHLVPVEAEFGHCLVLTYALPAPTLTSLLPAGLTLDTYKGYGFLAIAMVETRSLRPAFMPRALGMDLFLCGYRVFCRFEPASGPALRCLRILRSDTDRRLMSILGNALTHYRYEKADVRIGESEGNLSIEVRTPTGRADLHVVAALPEKPAPLPEGSPFQTLEDARRYAGPLPYTFAYEEQTRSICSGAWDH